MKKIKTNDGSETYHSDKFDETYHSVSGAVEESWKKYVEPCKIKDLAKTQNKINILDFCFGLGYNSAAAIEAVKEANELANNDCFINIIAIDNDANNFKLIKELNPKLSYYNFIKELAKDRNKTKILEKDNIKIFFIEEDARVALKFLTEKFDAVFFDPFSPKKCPELWTQEVFEDIYKLMKKGAILATYSCSKWIRENMKNAGFKVSDGPIVGRKSPGTVGVKD